MLKRVVTAVALGGLMMSSVAQAQEKLKIGVLVTLEGALTTLGEDGVRGLQIAIKEAGGKVVA